MDKPDFLLCTTPAEWAFWYEGYKEWLDTIDSEPEPEIMDEFCEDCGLAFFVENAKAGTCYRARLLIESSQ